MLGSFLSGLEERTATMVSGLVLALGDGLASWGRPASPLVRSSGFAGDSSILNFTAVSVRARWKKGQEEQPKGNCFPSLISQFMLGKWFSGQHHSRTTTGELGDTDRSCSDVTFSPLSSQDVMTSPRGHVVCHVFLFLLGSFFVIVRRR